MIGYIQGQVIFSDGVETIVLTDLGVGYQIYFAQVVPEGSKVKLYVSHIVKENSEELFGFDSLRAKKLFETLISVKGVGPKSAYSLMNSISETDIINAISFDNKKILQKAPGVGAKAAAQIILDLNSKMHKVLMYSDDYKKHETPVIKAQKNVNLPEGILEDVVLACKELGFKEEDVLRHANKLVAENNIQKPEQLMHLVLKEM